MCCTQEAWRASQYASGVINLADQDDAAARSVPPPGDDWCLFLDVDGTLLELADTPDGVEVDRHLLPLLERLRTTAAGAVALVSGRTIADVDALLGTTHFAVAGLHGSQRRDVDGQTYWAAESTPQLSRLRDDLARLVAGNHRVLLEDKGAGLAVHYAKAPEMRDELRATVMRLAAPLAPDFVTVEGRAVIEVRPAGHTKGSAVTAFMRQAPFLNRRPVFIGDDATDEDGFAAVNSYDGLAIAVGPRTHSQYWLPGPADVRCWLERLVECS